MSVLLGNLSTLSDEGDRGLSREGDSDDGDTSRSGEGEDEGDCSGEGESEEVESSLSGPGDSDDGESSMGEGPPPSISNSSDEEDIGSSWAEVEPYRREPVHPW